MRHKANAPTLESIYHYNVHKQFIRTISFPMHDLVHKYVYTAPLTPTRLDKRYRGRGKKHDIWSKHAVSLERDLAAKFVLPSTASPSAAYDKLSELVKTDIPLLSKLGQRVRRRPRSKQRAPLGAPPASAGDSSE